MGKTLKWTLHRGLHRKDTYVLLLILTACSLLVSGGVSKHLSTGLELNLMNVSYGVSFETMEGFLAWYRPHQYQVLVSATGMTALLPFLVNLFPSFRSQEAAVPVMMGRSRSQVFFAGLIWYYLMTVILWLCWFLTGFFLSSISLTPMFPLTYYVRTMGLSLWRYLGAAGLSLAVALLMKNRFSGVLLSFGFQVLLAMTQKVGLWRGTILSDLLYMGRDRTGLWMWAVESHPSLGQVLVFVLLPVVGTLLACGVGLFQFCRRDLC